MDIQHILESLPFTEISSKEDFIKLTKGKNYLFLIISLTSCHYFNKGKTRLAYAYHYNHYPELRLLINKNEVSSTHGVDYETLKLWNYKLFVRLATDSELKRLANHVKDNPDMYKFEYEHTDCNKGTQILLNYRG